MWLSVTTIGHGGDKLSIDELPNAAHHYAADLHRSVSELSKRILSGLSYSQNYILSKYFM
jgi:hypothetical protein